MAEKPDRKADAAAAAAGKDVPGAGGAGPEKKGGAAGLLARTPVMLGGVMLLEAAVLFAGFKFLGGGPTHAGGAEIVTADSAGKAGEGGAGAKGAAGNMRKTAEVNVLEFRAQNKLSGRTFVYEVSIYVVTKSEFKSQLVDTIKDREALIKDRVRTIIAQNDPEKLGGGSEPGLETLRRQVKHQLDEIVGDGLIDEVLIPKCIPIRSDF